MKRPCVAVDVSKGKSHYQAWINVDEKLGNPKVVNHDLSGFNEILSKIDEVKTKTKEDPVVVFESTGVYHLPLLRFLQNNQIDFIIVSPLESAKVRKSNIRSTKTDKRDCKNIARVYFIKDFDLYTKQDDIYQNMRNLNRYYHYLTEQVRKIKVQFRLTMDVVYPNFDKFKSEMYSDIVLETIKKYYHPDLAKNKKPSSIAKYLESKTCHKYEYLIPFANDFIEYAKNCASGCNKDSIECINLLEVINQLETKINEQEACLNELCDLASTLPNYYLIKSIPGIGYNIASRIMAELGDVRRFKNARALVAYCGLDPNIYQSGQIDGMHLSITKKGNKELRCLLYLACTNCIRTENKIRDYYNKKIADCKAYKTTIVACMNKLVRIIYSMCLNGCIFNNQ